MSADDTNLQLLHELTYGIQDVYIEKLNDASQLTYSRVIEHVTATLVSRCGGRVAYRIPKVPGFGVANVQMVGDNWSRASFLVGDQLFDRFDCARQGSRFSITDDGRCLPFVIITEFEIEAMKESSDDVQVEYDIVEVTKEINKQLLEHRAIDFLFDANQTIGYETIPVGDSVVRLQFNHPIKKIIVDVVSGHVVAMDLTLQIGSHNDKVPLQKVSDTQFILDMGKEGETINFSRVDKACLQVTATEESVIDPRATSIHVVKILSEMYGMALTK